MAKTYDAAVIGAGVFGAWTAYCLRRAGAEVLLIDAYGPGNSRASSGGESRIMRLGYGPDEIYTRSAHDRSHSGSNSLQRLGRKPSRCFTTPAFSGSHVNETHIAKHYLRRCTRRRANEKWNAMNRPQFRKSIRCGKWGI